jgi:hypothetical protein
MAYSLQSLHIVSCRPHIPKAHRFAGASSLSVRTLLAQLKLLQRFFGSVPSRFDIFEMRDNARRLGEMLLVGRRRHQRLLCITSGWRDVLVLHFIRFSHSCMLRCIAKRVHGRCAPDWTPALGLTQQQRHVAKEPMTQVWLKC